MDIRVKSVHVEEDDMEMNDNDLEQDCCPINAGDHDMPLDLSNKRTHHLGKFDHLHDEKRYDSGYKSVESLQSGNLGSDVNEGRLTSDDAAVVGLESLTLGNDNDEKSRLYSVDEGFESSNLKTEELFKSSASSLPLEDDKDIDSKVQDYKNLVVEVYQQDEDGDTRLHTAIIQLLSDLALYFIWLSPNPNCLNLKNNYLQTPLHLAVITKQDVVTRKLMAAGAQVDTKDHKGNTPLHIAAKEGYAYFVRILLTPVSFDETKDNDYSLPYQQIPQNLDARNYDGQLPVHLAAEGCHIEVLDVLLSKGADVNSRDGKSGRTILHYAAESGCTDLLRFLIEQTHCLLNLDATTYGGLTPIQLAKGRGHEEAVRLLREAGAFYDSEESSSEEEMNEDSYDDIKINGVIVKRR